MALGRAEEKIDYMIARASAVDDLIDGSGGYFRSPVDVACRSHMNVVFRLPSEDLEAWTDVAASDVLSGSQW